MPKQERPGRLGRVEREQRFNRMLSIGLYAVLAAVGLLVFGGYALETWVRPSQPVATVNGVEISTAEFQKRARFSRRFFVQQYLSLYQFLSSGTVDPAFAGEFQQQLLQLQFALLPESVGRQTLDDLIEAELIRQAAVEMGISVSQDEIDVAVREIFFSYYPEGEPTATITPTVVATSTLSATQLALVTLTPTLEATSVPPTATQTAAEAEATPTFVFPTATLQGTEAFGLEYQSQLDLLKSDVQWSEQDLRNYAEVLLLRDKLKASLVADLPRQQEQVWARHILVADLATAETVLERLAAGEDWAALALEYSQDTGNAARGGDLGWFYKERMVTEFGDAAFALEIGEISAPVESDFGFHIIQALGHELRPLENDAYLEYQDQVFNQWLQTRREQSEVIEFDYWLERVPTTPDIPAGARLN